MEGEPYSFGSSHLARLVLQGMSVMLVARDTSEEGVASLVREAAREAAAMLGQPLVEVRRGGLTVAGDEGFLYAEIEGRELTLSSLRAMARSGPLTPMTRHGAEGLVFVNGVDRVPRSEWAGVEPFLKEGSIAPGVRLSWGVRIVASVYSDSPLARNVVNAYVLVWV